MNNVNEIPAALRALQQEMATRSAPVQQRSEPIDLRPHIAKRDHVVEPDLTGYSISNGTNDTNRTNITNGIALRASPQVASPQPTEGYAAPNMGVSYDWSSPVSSVVVSESEDAGEDEAPELADQPEDEDEPARNWPLHYVAVHFFDNGPESATGKAKHTQYKANVHIKTANGGSTFTYGCSFNKKTGNFSTTIPQGYLTHDFYRDVADFAQSMRKDMGWEFDVTPTAGKLKDSNNHVIPLSAVVLWKRKGKPVQCRVMILHSQTSMCLYDEVITLDNDKPKGKAKCDNLHSIGHWNNPITGGVASVAARGFEHVIEGERTALAMRGGA